MRVELKHIKSGVLEQEYSCRGADFPEVAALMATDVLDYEGPVRFRLTFQQSGRMIEVRGRLDAIMRLSCARCLGSFSRSVAEEFSLAFVPGINQDSSDEEYQLAADELDLIPYQDDCLELLEPLQEQLLMAVPISALCGDECRGLCRECGADLNIKVCACEQRPFNNKFGALLKIKANQVGKGSD